MQLVENSRNLTHRDSGMPWTCWPGMTEPPGDRKLSARLESPCGWFSRSLSTGNQFIEADLWWALSLGDLSKKVKTLSQWFAGGNGLVTDCLKLSEFLQLFLVSMWLFISFPPGLFSWVRVDLHQFSFMSLWFFYVLCFCIMTTVLSAVWMAG